MILIRPNISLTTTELHIGRYLLSGPLLTTLCQKLGQNRVLIADQNLNDLYAKKLSQEIDAELILIPNQKSRETKTWIEDQLLEKGFGKDTVIIALGGGTITDLSGFVAATYLRGVPLILIPTTLLAMVDAAIGGKTAIDTSFGKNLLGTIYFPQAIIVDPEVLSSLPPTEIMNGMAEILKIGLISDPSILSLCCQTSCSIEDLVHRSITAKIQIIESDPFEKGVRRILNFGHTIGHALESIGNNQFPHGQAVVIGSLGALFLSHHLNYLSLKEFETSLRLYQRFFPDTRLPSFYNRSKLIEAMSHDKKKENNQIRFVLIDYIGHAMEFNGAYCRAVSPFDLETTLDWLEKSYG